MTPVTDLTPGKLYLHLFHGRNTPGEKMDDWGFMGPTFGPLESCHITYNSTLHLNFEDGEQLLCHSPDDDLHMSGDLLVYDGKYYGDWTLFVATDSSA